jgi:hypothetical protein
MFFSPLVLNPHKKRALSVKNWYFLSINEQESRVEKKLFVNERRDGKSCWTGWKFEVNKEMSLRVFAIHNKQRLKTDVVKEFFYRELRFAEICDQKTELNNFNLFLLL